MRKKRIQRFHVDQIDNSKSHLEIAGEQSHYVTRVLRLQTGDRMILFDGSGSEWTAKIIDTKRIDCFLSWRKEPPLIENLQLI